MSATSLQVITLDLPNPDYANPESSSYARVNSSLAFEYLTTFDIRTLSTNGIASGDDVAGLLYTPDLLPTSECINASAPYVPANATRLANLPNTDYDLVAIAPWVSPQCVQEYLSSAREVEGLVRGFLFYLPSDNGTETPPEVNSQVWGLGDGGSWKRDNNYPVYALPGASAGILMEASALYSRNISELPYGNLLVEKYNSTDYVRLLVDIGTAGSGSPLPSLWVFLLVVLGILLAIIGVTSLVMHWFQGRRREVLRRRIVNGDVDLEALGIKRLTVPQEILNFFPLYTYGTGSPVTPTAVEPAAGQAAVIKEITLSSSEKLSSANSRSSSPLPVTRPAPTTRSTSYRPTALQQPTCAICLDDFVPASEGSEGTVVRELPCHHIFHPECVDAFLRDSSSLCPMCKKSALPKGYCPKSVTNAMVRRERMVRRLRERVTDGSPTPARENSMLRESEDQVPRSLGERLRTRTFSGISQLRAGRRISSAPVQRQQTATEMTSTLPTPALMRSHTTTSLRTGSHPRQVQPPSNPRRREWARQRAIAMLGRPAAADADAEEARTTPRWRKALRSVFPGLGR
ncbi:hypothetical protein LTR91_016716 [Friedmanniomyces endolithicus]|uniref:RING-type domain-containing protein n=1 Tax=Friedmanniomyces endolithicus TaxID=329885 RepID=A0AAN6QK98_9PEZI|nr:hypothetical protein LTR35_015777 [Friedmanniomyces endolithicus]KAK0275823.1 hypothetical protein LTS00_014856 [Friedmanniomyces endolithicus]KAK0307832.1 hypothetical protein LTR82_015768 [Friedmanniomyces endolithicus]KAK0311886.1 hypothetical protein LTR01_002800 [Friedmanniomyces endolithicus]KAK0832119.1 hypothetical protein LTR73_002406 [Friedmanniomyces endolithicus]